MCSLGLNGLALNGLNAHGLALNADYGYGLHHAGLAAAPAYAAQAIAAPAYAAQAIAAPAYAAQAIAAPAYATQAIAAPAYAAQAIAAPAYAAQAIAAPAYAAQACGACAPPPVVSVPAVRYSTAVQTKTIPDHKLVQQQEQRVDIKQVVEKYQVADTKEIVRLFRKTEFVPVIKYEAIELEEEKTETVPVAKTLQRIRNVPTVSNHLRTTIQPSYKQVQVPVQVAHQTCVQRPACSPCGAYGAARYL